MQGSDIKALEDFRTILTSCGKPWRSVTDLRIRHLGALFEQLKSHPKLQLAIDI